ncbi:hypothetical protein EJF36_10065 [Bacillus sp. HMF5848]|uniref:DUF6526 family protein n=1 Tax=Bacillus sp. HMF5848 TaxID=2495421 RepID=UPI000F79FB48|nr:DUF6526 family protein [Bacillus sp. HMF5848]RSK27196.1 hypothetical protein EJF36_10065 [Bacillus sp. HMF5848]
MEQNYKKHAMIDPVFHFVLAPLSLISVIIGIVQFVYAIRVGTSTLTAVMLLITGFLFFFAATRIRGYALKLQDRLIRTEENFRYFVLTGKRLDSALSLKQIIALRFASDEEFPALVEEALEKNMTPDEIKRTIKNWRVDYQRV